MQTRVNGEEEEYIGSWPSTAVYDDVIKIHDLQFIRCVCLQYVDERIGIFCTAATTVCTRSTHYYYNTTVKKLLQQNIITRSTAVCPHCNTLLLLLLCVYVLVLDFLDLQALFFEREREEKIILLVL